MMTRRDVLATVVAAPAWLAARSAQAAPLPVLRNLGGTPTAFAVRSRANRAAFDMVGHCHALGMGAVQTRLSAFDGQTAGAFRTRVEGYGMRSILSAPLPREERDVAAFDAAVGACKEAGAVALHAAMTQRRYEEFDTLAAFKAHFASCQQSVRLAEPVLRKHRLRLAIENHKGWRAAEHAAWIARVASEWVGVCFDFGNNLALCEEPMDTLARLAPFTVFCHMKDMGVAPYDDGFLLSEVAFGQGIVDLAGIVKTLQQRDPQMIFALEMITRDPLRVPVYSEKYWTTFDEAASPLPGRDLARVLGLVRKHTPSQPLPRTTGLDPAAQVKLEDDLNQQCVDWSRQHLPL